MIPTRGCASTTINRIRGTSSIKLNRRHSSQHCEERISSGFFAMAAEVDREVSRLNGLAPPGCNQRLTSTEETARCPTSRDQPALVRPSILRVPTDVKEEVRLTVR